MIHKLSIQYLQRILLSQSSKIRVNVHLNKSYIIKNIFNANSITFSSCTKNNLLSRQFINIVKFSSYSNNMDGSGDHNQLREIKYEELLEAQKDNSVLIIDVREVNEINETGKLPGSIHIPMGNIVNMFNVSDEKFEREFKKLKPNKDTKIILSCRSGMRSGKVQQALQAIGYKNAYNYAGGWLEWEGKQMK